MEAQQIKPFNYSGSVFMPYPQRKPKDLTPIRVLTKENEVFNVIQIDTGFGREFVNEIEHVFLMPHEVKGWWYI